MCIIHAEVPKMWFISRNNNFDALYYIAYFIGSVNYIGRDVGALYIMLSFYYCPGRLVDDSNHTQKKWIWKWQIRRAPA